MPDTIRRELAALEKMTTAELVQRYEELHGHACRTRHRAYLKRKIAWRIQANAEGDLSERARRRAVELADDAEVKARGWLRATPEQCERLQRALWEAKTEGFARVTTNRVLTMQYDSLKEDPASLVASISRFLGLAVATRQLAVAAELVRPKTTREGSNP